MTYRWVSALGPLAYSCLLACGGDGAATSGDTGTTGGPDPTNTASSGGSQGDGEDSSTGTTGVDSGGESSDGSADTSTGDTGSPASDGVELLLRASDAGGHLKYFHYRHTADLDEGPLPIVPTDGTMWDIAVPLAGGRAVFRSFDATAHVVLGAIDDDDHLQELSIAPVPAGGMSPPVRLPGADAVLFTASDGIAYRVDLDHDAPSAPVVVARGRGESSPSQPVVDAAGRWTAFAVGTGNATDIMLARVDTPDPDAAFAVTAVAPTQGAYVMGMGGAGEDLFIGIYDRATFRVTDIGYVDLRRGTPQPAMTITAPLAAGLRLSALSFPAGGRGAVYRAADEVSSLETVWWVDIVDGAVSPPLELASPSSYAVVEQWTDDGRWFTLQVESQAGNVRYLFDMIGGPEPVRYEIDLDENDEVRFSPDGQWMFATRTSPDDVSLSRFALGDTGPGEEELVAISTPDLRVGQVEDFDPHGRRLVVRGEAGGAPQQLLIDLEATLPATPVVLNRPLAPGDGAELGEFSPDGAHVMYIERADAFGRQRLLVADVDDPGSAVVAMDPVVSYVIVREE